MRIGLAADHGGFALKEQLATALKAAGHELVDFGAHDLVPLDDYPDYVVPLARAVAEGKVDRGIAICGSGVAHRSPPTRCRAQEPGCATTTIRPIKGWKMTT